MSQDNITKTLIDIRDNKVLAEELTAKIVKMSYEMTGAFIDDLNKKIKDLQMSDAEAIDLLFCSSTRLLKAALRTVEKNFPEIKNDIFDDYQEQILKVLKGFNTPPS